MAARQLALGALLLAAGGFAAGRAFSQNEIPTGSDVSPPSVSTTVEAAPIEPAAPPVPADEPTEIPAPPATLQPVTESVIPQTTRPVAAPPRITTMPAKYFIPAGRTSPADAASVSSLRERFARIAAEKAAIMSAEELQSEITAIEKILAEFSAKQSLDRATKALEAVVREYPETEAGHDAKRALDAMKPRTTEARRY